jgi:hypothetical protein
MKNKRRIRMIRTMSRWREGNREKKKGKDWNEKNGDKRKKKTPLKRRGSKRTRT